MLSPLPLPSYTLHQYPEGLLYPWTTLMMNATTGNSHRRRYASDSFDGSRGLTQSSPVLRPIDRLTPLEEDHSQFLLIEEASDDEAE